MRPPDRSPGPAAAHGFAVTNGIRMFYVSEGTGPLVLFLHGFPEFWYSWRHQVGPVAAAGFRAVAVDLPGYGRSDKPDVHYDVVWVSRCLAGLVEALGHDRAVIVGHDWGGLVAWPMARLHPDAVASVVGVNTPDLPRLPVKPTELFAQLGDRYRYILEFQDRSIEDRLSRDVAGFLSTFYRSGAVRHETFTEDVLARYVEVFGPTGALTPPLEYYRSLDRSWELTEEIAETRIAVPCAMIMAAGDPVLTPALAEGMERRVPRLTKVLIEDCGHWTQQERPQETTRHLLSFLSDIERWE